MSSKIGVCILSYNRPEYLRKAIESVLNQSLRPSWVEIMDNGSDPSVKESVRGWIEDGSILWKGESVNKGVHWNFQKALARGDSADYLYIMHDDDVLLPSFLKEGVGFMSNHPELVALACNGYEIDSDGSRIGNLHNPKRRKNVEFFPSVGDMVNLYMKTFMAFPSIIYRGEFLAGVEVPSRFGQLVDVVFLTELARKGGLAYLNKRLFEYRVHGGQDSTVFKEDDWRLLEKYYLSLSKEFPGLSWRIKAYLARRRLSRYWKKIKRKLLS